jgi:diguanylate cyclase (GGDEF)-like protein
MTNHEMAWKPKGGVDALQLTDLPGAWPEMGWAIIDAMANPVLIYDERAVIRHANPAALRRFGFDPTGRGRPAVNRRLKLRTPDGKALPPDEQPSTRALRGDTVEGLRICFEDGAGQNATALVSAAPVLQQDQVVAAVLTFHDVTDLEDRMEQLDLEIQELRAVIQNAPEAMIILDAQGNILLNNPAARELSGGIIPESGGNLAQLGLVFKQPDGPPIPMDDLPPIRTARDGVAFTNVEMLIEMPGNQQRVILGSTSPVFDVRGVPSGAVAVFQDITQIKRSEEAIRRETARLELLSTLSQAIAEAGLYYPAVLSTIAQQVAESIGDGCIIRLVSDDSQWLDPVAFHHVNPEALQVYRSLLHATRKRVDEGFSGHVYRTGEPLILLDITQDELLHIEDEQDAAIARQYPVQNGIIVPLRAQNRFIGTLIVFRSHTRAPYSSEDQAFLQDLAVRAALAIENARLYAAEAQRARELDALHRAASALLSTLDLDALLGQILDAAQNAIPSAEKGLLHLINPGTSELRVRAMLGYQNPRIQRISGGAEQEYLLRAVKERRALLIHDTLAGKDPTDASVAQVFPAVRSAVVAPLILSEKVLGALSLSSSSPSAFSDADLRLLISLAATTTAAIQNALLHSEVQRLAITDALTGLYNRRGFYDLGQREIERFQRFGRTLSAIMLDIDHFKEVNDTYGHSAGDQVLATLARRCRTNIRHVDILCRYGGEEFAILLPETDLFTASEIAERIRRSIDDEPFQTDQHLVRVTISLGVTRAIPETSDLQALLERADTALYRAKANGRNRVELA